MTTLCTLQNLTLTYPHKIIFNQATFSLSEGEKIGVLGLNGHGKTSLFKILAGHQNPDISVPPFQFDRNKDFSVFLVPQEMPMLKNISVADYFFEFYPQFKQVKQDLDKIAAMMGQNQSKKTDDVELGKLLEKQTMLLDKMHELGEDKIYSAYTSYLKYFGMENHQASIESLSGGELRKIALALGLSSPAQIILWDEPTNHLDFETIELFEGELQNSNKTFMIISHDRTLLNNTVDRIVHIQHGTIRSFKGTYAEYLTFLQEEEHRREKEIDKLSNYHRRETAWIRRGAKARRTKSKKRIQDYSNLTSTIQDLKSKSHKQASLAVKDSGRKTKILADFQNISLSFGDRILLKDVSFKIANGDKIAIIGKNGVGKSSLLSLIMGKIQPSTGIVKTAENLSIGFFSQKREDLPLEISPWQWIGEGIDYVISNTGEKRHVTTYLENFLFRTEEIKRPIKTLSGGEKNRLQLAKFMKNSQDIWIFDEPTNDLDLETIGVLEEELKNFPGTLVIVGHDRSFIENVTSKCWLIHDKKIEFFDGGFSQAEFYLEALSLENEASKLNISKTTPPPDSSSPEKQNLEGSKISFKDRQRYEEVQKNLNVLETYSSNLKKKIESFDYGSMDKQKTQELEKLQTDLAQVEKKVEVLFEEWAQLEEKVNGQK